MSKAIKIFNLADSYGGGGSIFEDGTYRVETIKFTMYDFNGKFTGKDGDGVCCLMAKLQPVDDKTHKPAEGKEAVVQYWGAGEDTEPVNKGKEIGLRTDATHDVIWKGSDFYKFMECLGKAKFDMDKYEDEGDISALEGMVFEFGKMVDPYSKTAKGGKDLDDSKGKGDKKKDEPRLIVVVTGIPKQGAATKSKEKDEEPATKKKKVDADSTEPEDLVEAFLVSKFDDWEDDGVEKIVARAALNKAITKTHNAETAKECIQYWNKNLAAVLKAHGWELDKDDKIVKG